MFRIEPAAATKHQHYYHAFLRIFLFIFLLFILSITISLHGWPRPTMVWSIVESMAFEYMNECTEDLSTQRKENKQKPLTGTVTVITGATSGIGKSLTRVMYELGSTVVVMGRSRTRLKNLEQELLVLDSLNQDQNPSQSQIVTIVSDNADLESISFASNKILQRFDHIDFLVNNAGMHYRNQKNPLFWKVSKQGYDWLFVGEFISEV